MRIQVLNLPGAGDDYPFALVIDEAGGEQAANMAMRAPASLERFKNDVGAKAIVVFDTTVEVL